MMLDDRPTVTDVARLANAYCRIRGNASGGLLHVVLDDGNLGGEHLRYALARARVENDRPTEVLAALLLLQTRSQRGRVRQRVRVWPEYEDETAESFLEVAEPILARFCP